jgi:nucleoside-diphosphate-sugar epimerase
MMKVLVTGGAGFIGSAICMRLALDGHDVVSFDNYSRKSHINNLNDNIKTYNGDVRSIDNLVQCIKENKGFDAIWHFAYINGTSTFYSSPEMVLDVGVKGAINTLDAALQNDIKNYVLCSSSEVYNEPSRLPTPEDERMLIPDVYNPRFSYAGGKIISELLTIHYGAKQGLNTKIFRPHNVYGPNMGLEHVIPQIVKKILDCKGKDIFIQGSGNETRSFCFIEDAVEQMVQAATIPGNDTYNIGVEDEISIIELAKQISHILGIEINIHPDGDKPAGATSKRCPDMSKMTALGYQPKHKLYDGLKETVEWYRTYYSQGERNG